MENTVELTKKKYVCVKKNIAKLTTNYKQIIAIQKKKKKLQ